MASTVYFRDMSSNRVVETSSGSIYSNRDGYVKISKSDGKKAVKEQARDYLLTMIKPGQKVYTKINHVSASGMSRSISLYVVHDDDIINITPSVARLLGYNIDKYDGVPVKGCGMDMCFDTVYNLGFALWSNGTPEPHGFRNGEPDTDGGYALKSVRF